MSIAEGLLNNLKATKLELFKAKLFGTKIVITEQAIPKGDRTCTVTARIHQDKVYITNIKYN